MEELNKVLIVKFNKRAGSLESKKIVKIRVKFVKAEINHVRALTESEFLLRIISTNCTTFEDAPIGVQSGTKRTRTPIGTISIKKLAAIKKYNPVAIKEYILNNRL